MRLADVEKAVMLIKESMNDESMRNNAVWKSAHLNAIDILNNLDTVYLEKDGEECGRHILNFNSSSKPGVMIKPGDSTGTISIGGTKKKVFVYGLDYNIHSGKFILKVILEEVGPWRKLFGF